MAHDIAIDRATGERMMMYVGAMPWHKLGQCLGTECVTWEQAFKAAHLDWTVSKHRLMTGYTQDGQPTEIDAFGIFRDDNHAFIGTVGDVYKPIQNVDAFDFVDTLLGVSNGAHYETAGALGVGHRIWCLARIPEADFIIDGGDKHQSYLLFTTSHDGSLSAQAKITTTRVVCQNTLSAALANEGQLLKIKHTTNADTKLKAAKSMMGKAITSAKDLAAKLDTLSHRSLTRDSVRGIFERLFPPTEQDKANGVTMKQSSAISDILRLYETNDNNAFPAIRGSAYNMLNAFTEYTDHHRVSRVTDKRAGLSQEQARTESSLLGTGATFKSQVLEVIMEQTVNAPNLNAHKIYSVPVAPTSTGSQLLDSCIDSTIN
jgi:phage/plasmid-like protein (TIGR03299 family)